MIRQFSGESEKYWLRYAFSETQYRPLSGLSSLLPSEVLWRRKEAFSDGVSGEYRSLYQILQDYCAKLVPLNGYKSYEDMTKQIPIMQKVETNIPKTAEQYYYRYVFETNYCGMGHIIPYFWMPRFVKASDASARTLSQYKETNLLSN